MPTSRFLTIGGAAALCAAAACGAPPGPSGGGIPPGATPVAVMSSRDPVGFLLQFRDSLHLSDSVALDLVRLNLRLFRRNREAQIQIDSLMRGVRVDPRPTRYGDTTSTIPAELRDRIDPLQTRVREQTAAVRDTAWTMLTAEQRDIATAIEQRLQEQMRRRGGPGAQTTGTVGRP